MSNKDNQSTTSSVARKKAADNHCMAAECNGKKITANYYAEHKKTAKHDKEVGFKVCTGAECQLCRDHLSKFYAKNLLRTLHPVWAPPFQVTNFLRLFLI